MIEASATKPVSALDFSQLRAHYSRVELDEFRRWARNTEAGSHHGRDILRSVAVVVVVGFSLLIITVISLFLGDVALAMPDRIAAFIVVSITGTFIALSCVKLIEIWRRDVRFSMRWGRWMRMSSFAAANNMTYVPEILSPPYAGSFFTMGRARRASDVMTTRTDRRVEIGNYQFAGETGLDRSLNRCGYIRVRVDRHLPHLYLRSQRSRKFGATFGRFQQFALEGDFGKHFRLYAPDGYERDALYIFTPDLMAVLIDEAAAFDIEFVGNDIYFYSPHWFDMRDPKTYSRSARLVTSVSPKALKQTRAYSDARTSGDFVTVRGARLSRGVTVAAVIGVIVLIGQGYRLFQMLSGG